MTEGDTPGNLLQKWLASGVMSAISLKLIIFLIFTKGILKSGY